MLLEDLDSAPSLEELERRVKIMLPAEYQDSYEGIQPVSMRSAGLAFDADGNVAWNEIWATFCDLAMAGGPPHKGTLLEPAKPAAIEAEPERHRIVVKEIARGARLVTRLFVQASPVPGWVRISCPSEGMAGWLLRAITMENVAVRVDGRALDVPAGPHFRLEKEIKNVVTALAKTCHYWFGHLPLHQQRDIRTLFIELDRAAPVVTPAASGEVDERQVGAATGRIADGVCRQTGLTKSPITYAGWLGFECPDVRAAIWMMRLLVVDNLLARREDTVLFVAVNPLLDPDGRRVCRATTMAYRHAVNRGVIAAA